MATQSNVKFIKTTAGEYEVFTADHGKRIGTVVRSGRKWYYLTRDGHRPQPESKFVYSTRALAVAALVTAWEASQAKEEEARAKSHRHFAAVTYPALLAAEDATVASKPAAPAPAPLPPHGGMRFMSAPFAPAKPWHGLKRPDRAPVALIDTLLANDAIDRAEQAGSEPPPCAAAMGCLCAGHARGNPADAPCDTDETPPRSRGGGTLATILAFVLSFVGAFATGACSTVGTVQVKPATVGDVQLQALKAATEAIRAERATNVDADEADSDADDADCNRMAAPASDESDDDCDSDDTCATGHPLTIHAASEREADAVEAAVKARKPAPIGSETISALCPGRAFQVWDMGRDWHFICDVNGTRIVAPKSVADAGLTAVTKGNASAGWVR